MRVRDRVRVRVSFRDNTDGDQAVQALSKDTERTRPTVPYDVTREVIT